MPVKPGDQPLPSEAKRRLRTAAHRTALRFENQEGLRLLAHLRALVRARADAEAIEAFLLEVEAASCA